MADRVSIDDGEADTAVIAEYEVSRRALVRRGIAVGSLSLAAASIPALLRVRNAFAQADDDRAIIEKAVGLEQTAVFAYAAAVASGKLDARTTQVAELFGRHEQEHAGALTAALKTLGGTAPPKPSRPGDVSGLAAAAASARGILNFAIAFEESAVAAYYDASQKLKDAKLLTAGSSIMANEGQHLVVLRQAARLNPVPTAFATGKA
ncbi:MAG: ferritin-like domain-containing protein [Solirubrobacteraceae bacterium]